MFRCVQKCSRYKYKYECPHYYEKILQAYPYYKECCRKYNLIGVIKYFLYLLLHPFNILHIFGGTGGEIYKKKSYQPVLKNKTNFNKIYKSDSIEKVKIENEADIEELEIIDILKEEIIQRDKIKKIFPYRKDLILRKQDIIDTLITVLVKKEKIHSKEDSAIRRIK